MNTFGEMNFSAAFSLIQPAPMLMLNRLSTQETECIKHVEYLRDVAHSHSAVLYTCF